MDLRKSIIARHVWRTSTNAPNVTPSRPVAPVDFDPTDVCAMVKESAPVVDWRASSWDLLNGVDIRDHSDSIPGELFERLFKR